MRTCPRCQETKPIEDFSWKSQPKGIRQSRCKECRMDVNHTPTPRSNCDRCGHSRAISEKARRYNLCADCRWVLTPEELVSWERSDLEMSLWMKPGMVLY